MTQLPLTILQVITQRHLSGAERVCLTLSEALQQRGHRVVLLCKPDEAMVAEARRRQLDVRPMAISGKLNLLVPLRIRAVARQVRAHIIHSHLSTAGLWGAWGARLARIPSVAHVHALNSKQCFLFADVMVACSEGVRQHLLSQQADAGRIRVIHNGLEGSRFANLRSPAQVRAALGIPDGCLAICCVGHLAPKKGQEYLLEAVAMLATRWPDLRCYFLGQGEMRDQLQQKIEELALTGRVELLGFRPDVVQIMNALDAVVLPSLGKEGLPLVLIEAAFLGKPVMASRLPGVDEVVEDQVTGLLVPPGDVEQLATHLNMILEDRALRERMGASALGRARDMFTIDTMVARTEQLYLDLIQQYRKRKGLL